MLHEGIDGGVKKRGRKRKVKEEQEEIGAEFGVLKLMNAGNEDDVN